MKRKPAKKVLLQQSVLFKVSSPAKLAQFLKEEEGLIRGLAAHDKHNYLEWDSDGRWIENPKPALKRIQTRFNYLLSQIITPEYLHSGIKKRSYITNASDHSIQFASVKLDVKKFYPSARSAEVYRFFHEVLLWPRDVAAIGKSLLCCRGHLPTGGNASPLLSFWAYKPMFDAIDELAKRNDCLLTVYVDDMTLTGSLASRRLIHEARTIIGSTRLKAHKTHYFPAGCPKVITGVAQTGAGKALPWRRRKLIAECEEALTQATTDAERKAILTPLIGRLCEAVEIDPSTWQPAARARIANRRELELRLRDEPVVTPANTRAVFSVNDGSAPWNA